MEQLETHSSLGVWENGDIANIEREGRRRRGHGGEKRNQCHFGGGGMLCGFLGPSWRDQLPVGTVW